MAAPIGMAINFKDITLTVRTTTNCQPGVAYNLQTATEMGLICHPRDLDRVVIALQNRGFNIRIEQAVRALVTIIPFAVEYRGKV